MSDVETNPTNTESTEAGKEVNFLAMSDEDFAKLSDDDIERMASGEELESIGSDIEDDLEDEPEEVEEELEDDSEEESSSEEDLSDEATEDSDEEDEVEVNTEDSVEESSINYEEEYKRILAPFKANGKEVKVESIDEAVQLMQMGANYAKKMASLKPNLKVLKMLEKNGLLDESKLNYLIDLDKKNPEAIKKLVVDSNIDPLDIDSEDKSSYTPNNYSISDKEFSTEEVINELQETPTGNKTIDIIGNKWDSESRRIVIDQPQIMKTINGHVASGIYDQVTTEVERRRMLGQIGVDVPDLVAYKQVGDELFLNNTQAPGSNKLHTKESFNSPQKEFTPKPKQTNKVVSRKKKSAAISNGMAKGVKTTESLEGINVLSMSDEEFEAFAAKHKLF